MFIKSLLSKLYYYINITVIIIIIMVALPENYTRESGPQVEFVVQSFELRKLPLYMISSYEKSYCISIHKSQGSEYENVYLILSKQSQIFGRELFYTGLTRTKSKIEIVSSDNTIKQLVKNESRVENNLFRNMPAFTKKQAKGLLS